MEPSTTLVCLFLHERQAQAALVGLRKAGVPEASVTIIGGDGASVDALDKSELADIGMPNRDYDRLKNGIGEGGVVLSVSAMPQHVATVESIFQGHQAEKIDDVEQERHAQQVPAAAAPLLAEAAPLLAEAPGPASDATTIPVIEENLAVGKRTVDQGGVLLYRRIVEIPVEQDVTLREEQVHVNRTPVDRPISSADEAFQERVIELTETAEEVVVSKEARVVEEIVVNKDVVEHTETVHDTVRHTLVDVEQIEPDGLDTSTPTGRAGR